jgi:amino acid transporter
MNAITEHGTCTVVFVVVGLVITIAISLFQTLEKIGWIGWLGLAGIMSATITLAVSVGVQDRPSAAPATGPWDPNVIIVGSPSFVNGISAVSTVVFSYAGTPNFFNIISEMRRPQEFKKTVIGCQAFVTAAYLVGLWPQVRVGNATDKPGHRLRRLPLLRPIRLVARSWISRPAPQKGLLRSCPSRTPRGHSHQLPPARQIRYVPIQTLHLPP